MPTLYLMRHGKAENTIPDIDRHLSSAGKDNISSIAKLLRDKSTNINRVIYSSAERAKQTALLMCEALNISPENQFEDARIYNASVSELQTVLTEIDEPLESVLFVGHNPGFADLVFSLCDECVGLSPGNIAVMYGESWDDFSHCNCRFVEKV